MLKPKLITILSIVFFALSFNLSRAECNLNLKNLSINNQTNTDKTDIVRLQSILYINELYDGPITGYYGNLTSKAINNLKKQYNLKQDGIVDDLVINILCDNYTLCPFRSDLKKDSEYPVREIKTIQSFLRLIPNIYPERLVTGYYGSKTENAVKRLQKQLDISQTGRMDITTRNAFCSFFNSFDDISNTNTNTSTIFQTLCLAFPKQVKTGDNVLFISQILGGTSPYKYIWNNKDTNNDKTFKTVFPKSGTYTVGLKVIDSKGNISSTNCSVSVTGESISDLDWNGLSLDEGSSPIASSPVASSKPATKMSTTTTTVLPRKAVDVKYYEDNWMAIIDRKVNSQDGVSIDVSVYFINKNLDNANPSFDEGVWVQKTLSRGDKCNGNIREVGGGSVSCLELKKINAYDVNVQKQESYLGGRMPFKATQDFYSGRLQRILPGVWKLNFTDKRICVKDINVESKLVQYPIYISPNYLDENLLRSSNKMFHFLSDTLVLNLKDSASPLEVTIGVNCDNINDKTVGTRTFGSMTEADLKNNPAILSHPNVCILKFGGGMVDDKCLRAEDKSGWTTNFNKW